MYKLKPRNMRPSLAVDNASYICSGDIKFNGNRKKCSSRFSEFNNSLNRFLSQFVKWSFGSKLPEPMHLDSRCRSSFLLSVIIVILMRSKKQMRWIYAFTVVAFMQAKKT